MTATIKSAGNFYHCTAGDGSFAAGAGSEASGNFYYCTSGDTSFGAAIDSGLGEDPIASGVFVGCVGGDSCFGSTSGSGDTQATGTFTDCTAGENSFGGIPAGATGVSTFSGAATNCNALDNSFGSSEDGGSVNNGTMINCRLDTNSWRSPFTGRMDGCVITSSNRPITVDTGAFVINTTLIGPTSTDGVSGTGTVAIAHCRMVAAGIAGGVTNSIGTPYNVIDDDIV